MLKDFEPKSNIRYGADITLGHGSTDVVCVVFRNNRHYSIYHLDSNGAVVFEHGPGGHGYVGHRYDLTMMGKKAVYDCEKGQVLELGDFETVKVGDREVTITVTDRNIVTFNNENPLNVTDTLYKRLFPLSKY